MGVLTRYIGRVVTSYILIALLLLLIIYFFSSLLGELNQIGRGHYDFAAVIRYSLMLLPRQAYELFPTVALLGSMLGLGALAATSELLVMRAAGLSIGQIQRAVLISALLLALLSLLIGEVVAPPLEKAARLQRAEALAQNFSANSREGLWARDGETFINIRLFTDSRAIDLRLYRFEARQLRQIITAQSARYQQDHWLLLNVTVRDIDIAGSRYQQLPELRWESSLKPALLNLVAVKPVNLSLFDLYEYTTFMQANGMVATPYQLAFWKRLFTPLVTAGMVLLALPFVFGSLRDSSAGQRLLIGTLLGIGFYLFNAIFSEVALVYTLPPLLAALLPTLIVYGLWGWLMRRID